MKESESGEAALTGRGSETIKRKKYFKRKKNPL